MLSTNELAGVYDALLSMPGMNEKVKVNLNLSRKDALLLGCLIKKSTAGKEGEKAGIILDNLSAENLKELGVYADEILSKSEMTDVSIKLTSLGGSRKE
ncbi:hypothetical protein [Mucilaginibacter defluvii]|uniref:Uncharacterized protein n=1 Tax=Mucilaginibacter defluvii TaxID=1196019 RepID=A0ABP9FKC6_9SPHI